jgi:hypothetical protein
MVIPIVVFIVFIVGIAVIYGIKKAKNDKS